MTEQKKKVYTLTFHHVLNNGGVVQAYALQRFLMDSGFNAIILNYLPNYFLFQTYRPAKGIRKTIEKFKKIVSFRRFRKDNLVIDKKIIRRASDLAAIKDGFAVVVGSDQVWNPRLTGGNVDDTFYLRSLPLATKRLSYAASSGGESLLPHKEQLAELLSKFDFLGVREESLAEELTNSFQLSNCEVVLDPSLIINDYNDVLSTRMVPKEPFILTYVVASGETLREFDDYILSLKNSSNLKVVHVGAKDIRSADVIVRGVGPSDWLGFIKSASFVVTNSFHGTALSIKFERQFLFFPNSNQALNHRQSTLLSSLNLSNRKVVTTSQKINDLPLIDYDVVTKELDQLVEKSRSALLSSLKQ